MVSSRNLQGVGGDDTELNKIDGKREEVQKLFKTVLHSLLYI